MSESKLKHFLVAEDIEALETLSNELKNGSQSKLFILDEATWKLLSIPDYQKGWVANMCAYEDTTLRIVAKMINTGKGLKRDRIRKKITVEE